MLISLVLHLKSDGSLLSSNRASSTLVVLSQLSCASWVHSRMSSILHPDWKGDYRPIAVAPALSKVLSKNCGVKGSLQEKVQLALQQSSLSHA